MIEAFLITIAALFIWGPDMVQTPNSGCYMVDKNMAQHRPCRVEETR